MPSPSDNHLDRLKRRTETVPHAHGSYLGSGGGGTKDDAEKTRFELFPGDALRAICVILTLGAMKYEDRNWERGMDWGRVYGALQRHLWAWWGGEDTDQETGKSHLWHAGCCVVFLIAYEMRGIGNDDRPVNSSLPK